MNLNDWDKLSDEIKSELEKRGLNRELIKQVDAFERLGDILFKGKI